MHERIESNGKCPFCGGNSLGECERWDDQDRAVAAWIECGECLARGPEQLIPEDARKAWDLRVPARVTEKRHPPFLPHHQPFVPLTMDEAVVEEVPYKGMWVAVEEWDLDCAQGRGDTPEEALAALNEVLEDQHARGAR